MDGTLTSISDKRLKKNIESLPSLIDRIVLLEPVTYEMKADNPTHFRTTGFVAQQVDELFPQLITKDCIRNAFD
ncbi:MAG: tail fiber domain-containing protein [Chitinophagaceae bacterium]|nr:tail fiber domain-containing protein [Chitinophagaceae bacterium]